MASTACELQWTYISITIGAVAVVAGVLFIVLIAVGSALSRRQKKIILTLRRLLAEARMNQATSAPQVQALHPGINIDQHHSSLDISEEPVYADIQQEDDSTLTTTKNVAYGQIKATINL